MPTMSSFSSTTTGGFGLLRKAVAAGNPTHLGSVFDYSIWGGTVTVAGASSANRHVGGADTGAGITIGDMRIFAPDPRTSQAASDIQTAIAYFNSLEPHGSMWLGAAAVVTSPNFSADMAGVRFTPGVYFAGAAITNSGVVTCDGMGDPNSIFVFRIGAAFAPAAASSVELINGAKSENVFWSVTGATDLGASAVFRGTVLSPAAIACGAGAQIFGRILTNAGAVTMSANPIFTT